MKGETEKALAAFDRALTAEPSLSQARLNRGLALLKLGKFADASAEMQKVFANESSPVRADAAYHNAIALDRLGRAAEAETWLDRAIALDNDLDAALLYAGMLRERRGDLQGAGRAYLKYLEAHPTSVVALLRFGVSAQKSGSVETAKTYLRRVIELSPDSAEATEARKFLVLWE